MIAARTLLQQAVPTTFGLKAAGWLVAVGDARERLAAAAAALPAQLGGAGGTLAAFGEHGPELLRLFAAEVDLAEPRLPWHTLRTPMRDLAGALPAAAGALSKIAGDIVLLAQTEVGEVAEAEPRAVVDDAAQAQPRRRRARRARARGTRRRTRRCSRRSPSTSTSGRPVPGTRSGRRSRRRSRPPPERRARCAARSTGWRSTASGCARTSSADTLCRGESAWASTPSAPGGLPRLGRRAGRPRARRSYGAMSDACRPLRLARVDLARSWDAQLARARGARDVCSRFDHPGHGGAPLVEVRDVGDLAAPRRLDAARRHVLLLSGSRSAAASGCGSRSTRPSGSTGSSLACTVCALRRAAQWLERAATVRAEGLEAIVDAVLGRWFTPRVRRASPRVPRDDPLDRRPRAMHAAARRSPTGTSAPRSGGSRADARASRAPRTRPRRPPTSSCSPRRSPARASRWSPRRAHLANVERPGRLQPTAGGVPVSNDDGMRVRREVLGDEHVDRATERTNAFTADFQDLITRYAWGEIWTRPGPRPPDAQLHHAHGAGRARPPRGARDARARGAAKRPDRGRDQGGAAAVRRSTAASRPRTARSPSRSGARRRKARL